MKKTNNKGFSLVELIIVIAIMAILAGAIAPALIKYIDKSRKSNDVSSAKTIKTAVETALGTEDVYVYLTTAATSTADAIITITPNKNTATDGVSIPTNAGYTVGTDGDLSKPDMEAMIFDNIGEKTPKIKFQKAVSKYTSAKPTAFYVGVSNKGTVSVYIGSAAPTGIASEGVGNGTTEKAYVMLAPDVSPAYQ